MSNPDTCCLCEQPPGENGTVYDYVATDHDGETKGVCAKCADALRLHRDRRDFIEMKTIGGDLSSIYGGAKRIIDLRAILAQALGDGPPPPAN